MLGINFNNILAIILHISSTDHQKHSLPSVGYIFISLMCITD